MLSLVEQVHRTIVWANPSFRFHVITSDLDDDKFADCAITTHADYVVTEDGHLNQLIGSGYKPQPIAPAEFIDRPRPIGKEGACAAVLSRNQAASKGGRLAGKAANTLGKAARPA